MIAAVAALAALAALAACGKKGPPLPPLTRVPAAAADLEATLADGTLELAWTASAPPAPGAARVSYDILWEVESPRPGPGPAAGGAAAVERLLAGGRRAGGPQVEWGESGRRGRRLEARVEVGDPPPGAALRAVVVARSGRRSAPSLPIALTVPPRPLPAPGAFAIEAEAEGIRLRWEPLTAAARVELFRAEGGGAEPGALVSRADPAAGEFLDRTVRLGSAYRYAARLREAAGERAWAAGPLARAGPLEYSDAFPPAPPRGLTLLFEAGGARLLWSPGREPDLAGYRIYRRLGDGGEEAVGSVRGWEVTWVDAGAPEGERVEYRVTAFDASPRANESAPSEPAAGVVRRPMPLLSPADPGGGP